MIKLYNTNVDVLVVRKSDYQNNNIGDGYFIVPKEEWLCESINTTNYENCQYRQKDPSRI